MNTVLAVLVDGVVYASWLFLIAAGLSVIYGVLGILNMAHGSIYAIGAFVAAIAAIDYSEHWSWAPGSLIALLLGAVAVGLIVGPLLERGVLRWIYGHDPILQLLATYALFLIFEDIQRIIWGGKSYSAFVPYASLGSFSLAGITYPKYYIVLVAVAIVAGVAVWALFGHTNFGRSVTAVTFDHDVSRAMGINLSKVSAITFTLGAFLAALGGAFTAPTVAVLPGFAVDTTVAAFAVVVIGGLGSMSGAAAGALIVGIVRAIAIHQYPAVELYVTFILMAVVLLIRPQGLFAREAVRRI